MSEKWKSSIGIELQELLRQYKVSQGCLAGHLGVKAASVTYLLHGRIRMSRERLEQILTFIHAEAADVLRFETMWEEANQAPRSRSDANLARFCCRCRAGLTPAAVCLQTGISAERLNELENIPSADPAVGEIEVLKELYKCDSGVLWGSVPLIPAVPKNNAELSVQESPKDAVRSVQISLLDGCGLGRYRESCEWESFLQTFRGGVENIEYSGAGAVPEARIVFPSSRLGWDMKGEITLFLKRPESEPASGLYLSRSTHGVFRLLKRRGRFWVPLFSAFVEKKVKPAWCIPVVSFTFLSIAEQSK